MKVDTMRAIDRWAGIPLVLCCSLLLRLKRLITFSWGVQQKPAQIDRTLFIELSEMGSAIIADPSMRLLHSNGAELYFVIFGQNAKSLDILGTVPAERRFLINEKSLMSLCCDVLRFIFWCRKHKINTVIDLELFSRFTALLSLFSGASSRVGFSTAYDEGCYRGSLITHPVRYNSHIHMAKNFVALVNATLGYHPQVYPIHAIAADDIVLAQKSFTKAQRHAVWHKLQSLCPDLLGREQQQRLVLINANGSDLLPQRRWLPEHFCTVIQAIIAEYPDVMVLLTGSPAERDGTQELCDMVDHQRCLNIAGLLSFDELIILYDLATAMLTNDSGPNHFAAATKLKVYTIFGPETPALYGSLGNAENFYLGLPCSPCVSAFNHRKTSCEHRACIMGITPDMVLAPLRRFLAQTSLEQDK